jgi:hypothetical protein
MANPNTSLPEPEQIRSHNGLLTRFAAKAAIGLTMLGAGSAALESTAAAMPERQPTPVIKTSLAKLNHIKVGDTLKVLDGRAAFIGVHRGATVYRQAEHEKGVHKETLGEGLQMTHGFLAGPDDKPVATFKMGESSYCLPLTGRNTKYLDEFIYDKDYTGHVEPFSVDDTSSSTARVSLVHGGAPYEASSSSEASAQHVNGKWVVPLAKAITY